MLLKGIKVLDLSNLLPGPMCSLFLADLGAEVIKVESPKGDFMRYFESIGGKSPYFSSLNRNKKSIVLNLKTNEDREIFLKLAKDADVIIEGFRPGKMEALGLGYDDMEKINSKIIYCSISGYGQEGPCKDRAGHDLNYSALSGLLDTLSPETIVPGVEIAGISSSLIAAFSIVSSLFYREMSNKGNYIDVPIFNSALSLVSMHMAMRSLSGDRPILSGSKPCYNIYETKDNRHISFCAVEAKFWESFCAVMERSDLLQRQFDDSAIRDLKGIFKSKTMDEWTKLNEKHNFCCEPVRKLEELSVDGHLKDSKALIELDGILQVSMPAVFSSFDKRDYVRAPRLGEHTEEILHSVGCDDKKVRELRTKKVIS